LNSLGGSQKFTAAGYVGQEPVNQPGGPNFLGAGASETNIVAATTITGDALCKATNVTYRTDTASARNFLSGFVTLPVLI
jgi:hypothetical protein